MLICCCNGVKSNSHQSNPAAALEDDLFVHGTDTASDEPAKCRHVGVTVTVPPMVAVMGVLAASVVVVAVAVTMEVDGSLLALMMVAMCCDCCCVYNFETPVGPSELCCC